MAVDPDDEDDKLDAISAADADDEPDDDDRDEDGDGEDEDGDDDDDDDNEDEGPVAMSAATTSTAPPQPPPDATGQSTTSNQAATSATPPPGTQATTNAQAATGSQAAGAQSATTDPAAAGATTGAGASAAGSGAIDATGETAGAQDAGGQDQAAAQTTTATNDQSAGVRQDASIEQYIAVAQQNAAKNAVDTSEAAQLRAELNSLRASIEERISDARQSLADQLAEAQQAIAARQAVAPQQTVEVVQKVVVVQEQAAQPTAPAQIININVDNSVVNNVAVQSNVTVIQGGAQQTQIDGTAQSDIVCAAANNAVLTGGAGDDILVAGSTDIHLADLVTLNGSGARGTAILVQDADTLTVRVDASGLEPDQVHIQDINGRFAGDEFSDAGVANAAANGQPTPIDSVVPPRGADTDGDGFVEYEEQLPYTGPGIMGLASPQGDYATGFPTAGSDGRISFMQAYDLRGDIDPVGFTKADLLPLELRTVVLYGQTVGAEGDGTAGEVNGIPGYKPVLPVAAGEIELIAATARVESNVTVNATLEGGAGDDILLGKSGNDVLRGDAGDDWLSGGGGQNRLDGGDGADAFVLGRGQDLVEDFDFNEGDRLLVAGDQTDVNAVIASAVATGTGVRLATEDNGEVTLVGVAAGDVNAEWFTAV